MDFIKDFDCIYENGIDKKTTKQYEGMFTQGSGYMHIRGSYEEGILAEPQNEEYMRMPANVTLEKAHNTRSKFGTYIPGITGNHPLLNEELVNLPFPFSISVYVDNERFDVDECNVTEHKRWLDFKDGVLYRHFVWNTESGVKIVAEYRRFVSRYNPNIAYWQGNISSDKTCKLYVEDTIFNDVKTNGYNHFKETESRPGYCRVVTDTNEEVVISSEIHSNKAEFYSSNGKTVMNTDVSEEGITITKACCFHTSRDGENVSVKYESIVQYLSENSLSYDDEYMRSYDCWKSLWESSRIKIKGDADAQLAVDFSTYHMLRSINQSDNRVAICAKGYAGEAYFGHYFWDTEVYLLPFYLYTNTKLAKSLVEFRIKTLPGAMKNAVRYHYDGAKYSWESSIYGDEQCPNWQYADNEIHITADVVFGLWHYYKNTEDIDFLKNAIPVFVETSKYWCSRVYENKDATIHINGVMGPDEYICFCNDNTYTNYMVKYALSVTVEAIDILMDVFCGKIEDFGTTNNEYEKFKYVAENIVIEKRNDGLYWQCKDFDKFEDVDFSKVWTDRSKMFGSIISQERNYRSKALKQADVLMLPYMFSNFMTDEELDMNFSYYYPITTHDSSLSNIIHSILLSRMGDTQTAYKLFKKSVEIDLNVEKCGAAEGIHIANCGGIWQSIIFGFAGLQRAYESDKPTFKSILPKHWEEISFNLEFKGKKYSVTITKEGVQLFEKQDIK